MSTPEAGYKMAQSFACSPLSTTVRGSGVCGRLRFIANIFEITYVSQTTLLQGAMIRVLYALNAGLRFALELASLFALGQWGFASADGLLAYACAFALPLTAASVWGIFTVPGDPSRGKNGPVAVSGRVRLLLEALFFASGVWALSRTGQTSLALALGVCVCFHYACGWDRTRWLLEPGRAVPPRAFGDR
jgi:hypothetical protein